MDFLEVVGIVSNSCKIIFSDERGVIACGDSLRVMRELGEDVFELILTDPPYNVSKVDIKNLKDHKDITRNFGNWDYGSYEVVEYIELLDKIIKQKGSAYIFCGDKQLAEYYSALNNMEYDIKDVLVWRKTNPPMKIRKRTFVSAVEFILYIAKSEYVFNWQGQNEMHNIFTTSIVMGNERFDHPTQKPLSVVKKLMLISSNEGDLVFDGFCGSGTTAQAAVELNRKFICIDAEEKYCKMAASRVRQMQLIF